MHLVCCALLTAPRFVHRVLQIALGQLAFHPVLKPEENINFLTVLLDIRLLFCSGIDVARASVHIQGLTGDRSLTSAREPNELHRGGA